MYVEVVSTQAVVGSTTKFYVGLDLAALESRCSGYAVIVCSDVCVLKVFKCLYSDDEILDEVLRLGRSEEVVVSVDAPFSIGSGMRDVDRKMLAMGFKVFPPGFSHMRRLTVRAEKLVHELISNGLSRVYETHPRSALLSSRCSSVEEVLGRLGIILNTNLSSLRKDVRDAIIAATVSYCIDNNCCVVVEGVDGRIILLNNICSNR
jgi:predicted nuclease with RNAse H fold